jgi:hypothetical protein
VGCSVVGDNRACAVDACAIVVVARDVAHWTVRALIVCARDGLAVVRGSWAIEGILTPWCARCRSTEGWLVGALERAGHTIGFRAGGYALAVAARVEVAIPWAVVDVDARDCVRWCVARSFSTHQPERNIVRARHCKYDYRGHNM